MELHHFNIAFEMDKPANYKLWVGKCEKPTPSKNIKLGSCSDTVKQERRNKKQRYSI